MKSVTRLPRSCSCGAVHQAGVRCPVSQARRGTTTERMGPGWQSISKRVIARDHGECQLRRAGCTGTATTTDHVVGRALARRWGWTLEQVNAENNLVAACRHCNSSKGER